MIAYYSFAFGFTFSAIFFLITSYAVVSRLLAWAMSSEDKSTKPLAGHELIMIIICGLAAAVLSQGVFGDAKLSDVESLVWGAEGSSAQKPLANFLLERDMTISVREFRQWQDKIELAKISDRAKKLTLDLMANASDSVSSDLSSQGETNTP